MSYLTLALPAPMTETAKLVSRSLDPDFGGYEAFQTQATNASNVLYAVYGFPCSDEFKAQALAFKTNPAALHYAVTNDPRWQGQPMPTLAEVENFCAQLLISTAYGTLAGLGELGLTLVVVTV